MNIRHFFISDRLIADGLSIECCPTDNMTGDFFTKPSSGSKFCKFRRQMLNLSDDVLPQESDGAIDSTICKPMTQECVEE